MKNVEWLVKGEAASCKVANIATMFCVCYYYCFTSSCLFYLDEFHI